MTTLTSMIRPAAAPTSPAFRVSARLSAVRGLVVFCVSALIAASFVLDLAGRSSHRPPSTQLVQQASYLT